MRPTISKLSLSLVFKGRSHEKNIYSSLKLRFSISLPSSLIWSLHWKISPFDGFHLMRSERQVSPQLDQQSTICLSASQVWWCTSRMFNFQHFNTLQLTSVICIGQFDSIVAIKIWRNQESFRNPLHCQPRLVEEGHYRPPRHSHQQAHLLRLHRGPP